MPDVNIQLLRGGGKADALHVKEMIKNGKCQVWYALEFQCCNGVPVLDCIFSSSFLLLYCMRCRMKKGYSKVHCPLDSSYLYLLLHSLIF